MRFAPLAVPLMLAACRSAEPAARPAPEPVKTSAAEAPDSDSAPEPPPRVDVIRLSYAESRETAKVVDRALGHRRNGTLLVVSEPRTNSLIVSGRAEELAAVRELLAQIDVELPEAR
jgi:type II secretory pathway component GspD/PulD (secretin)